MALEADWRHGLLAHPPASMEMENCTGTSDAPRQFCGKTDKPICRGYLGRRRAMGSSSPKLEAGPEALALGFLHCSAFRGTWQRRPAHCILRSVIDPIGTRIYKALDLLHTILAPSCLDQ